MATRGYSEVLGEGGFGVVYKGCLRGTQVAIKKLNPEGLQVRLALHENNPDASRRSGSKRSKELPRQAC
jgi:predicted Ser/Thr protein kinase